MPTGWPLSTTNSAPSDPPKWSTTRSPAGCGETAPEDAGRVLLRRGRRPLVERHLHVRVLRRRRTPASSTGPGPRATSTRRATRPGRATARSPSARRATRDDGAGWRTAARGSGSSAPGAPTAAPRGRFTSASRSERAASSGTTGLKYTPEPQLARRDVARHAGGPPRRHDLDVQPGVGPVAAVERPLVDPQHVRRVRREQPVEPREHVDEQRAMRAGRRGRATAGRARRRRAPAGARTGRSAPPAPTRASRGGGDQPVAGIAATAPPRRARAAAARARSRTRRSDRADGRSRRRPSSRGSDLAHRDGGEARGRAPPSHASTETFTASTPPSRPCRFSELFSFPSEASGEILSPSNLKGQAPLPKGA